MGFDGELTAKLSATRNRVCKMKITSFWKTKFKLSKSDFQTLIVVFGIYLNSRNFLNFLKFVCLHFGVSWPLRLTRPGIAPAKTKRTLRLSRPSTVCNSDKMKFSLTFSIFWNLPEFTDFEFSEFSRFFKVCLFTT